MTIAVHPDLPAVEARKPSRDTPLEPYIVCIQPLQGDAVEEYWIDGRSKAAAMHRAARHAGVPLDRVVSAERYGGGKGG